LRRVLIAGLVGGIVLIAWFVVADGILGFKRSVEMSSLGEEREVYAFLAQHVTTPGRYVCNPEVSPGAGYPGDAPIFAVQYSGLGHADAGQEIIVGLVAALLACTAGAWVLAHASSAIMSRYRSRVLLVVVIGVIAALLEVVGRFGISGYALGDALLLGVHDLAGWALAGLAIAWVVRPVREPASRMAG
jgi:hypothetical protein